MIVSHPIQIIAYPTLAAYLILMIRTCVQHRVAWAEFMWGRIKSSVGALHARLIMIRPQNLSQAAGSLGAPNTDSNVERLKREAHALATRQRLAYCRQFHRFFMHFNGILLLVFGYVRHLNGVWDSNDEGQDPSSDLFMLCIFFVISGMIAEIRPQIVNQRFVDFMHVVLMSLLSWKKVANEDVFLMVFRSRGILPVRICAALYNGNPCLTFVLNSAHSFASSLRYVSCSRNQTDASEKFKDGHEVWFAFDDILCSIVISVASYLIEWRALSESRAVVEARLAKQAEATINSLLAAQCDAVVRLSAEFEIVSGSKSLYSLLLRQSSSTSSFLNIIQESDRQRFLDYSAACRCNLGVSGPASPLHVSMLDANGTRVQTQIFMVGFADLDNQCEFLLGIRELSRDENEAIQPQLLVSTDHMLTLSSRRQKRRERTQSDVSGSSNTSSASLQWESCASSASSEAEEDIGAVSFLFNLGTFKICKATPSFIALGGPSTVGADIRSWLSGDKSFILLVQEFVDRSMRDGFRGPFEVGSITLRPLVARRAQLEYRAQCSLKLLCASEGDTDDDDMIVHATLTALEQRLCKGRRRSNLANHARGCVTTIASVAL